MAAPTHEAGDCLARALILGLLVSYTFLQKIAIPGTDGGLPLSLLAAVGLLGLGLALGRLVPAGGVTVALLACVGVLTLTAGASRGTAISPKALALVAALLVPYAFTLRPGAWAMDYAHRRFVQFAALFALLGLLQFFAQFAVGADVAFALDLALPPDLLLSGFNTLNELSYQAGIYKANGVFLLEASFLSQFLCLAILVELLHGQRLHYLALLAAGALVTYSGTGLLMLAAILPAYLLHRRQFVLLGLGILGVAVVALLGQAIGLGALLDRTSELSSNQSSGFARFLSIFYLLDQFVWVDPHTILFGRGPGSVRENFAAMDFSTFDPSWGKMMYEYGLVGFLSYVSFLGYCLHRAGGSAYLKAALAIQFLFLGGYAAIAPVHIEIWILLVWPAVAVAARPPARKPRDDGRLLGSAA